MNKIKNHSKELIVLTILLAVAVSVVNAAVFVYYPISITASWVQRPVYFSEGSNANKADLGSGNTIEVNAGSTTENTTLTIKVHPCSRQTTYYKDIARIVNGDNSKGYYYGFRVTGGFGNTGISSATLYVKSQNGLTTYYIINLKETGTYWNPNSLPLLSANEQVRIDLNLTLTGPSDTSDAASIELIYSPVRESLP